MSGEREPTDTKPFLRPRFLKEIEELGNEIGFIDAAHDVLQRDGITVNVDGDVDRLSEHDGGILFLGDHKNRWEFVALMDLLGQIGRSEMVNIAKFYVQRQVRRALGEAATKLILPVYPRLLASDRKDVFNSEIVNRLVYRNSLLTAEESAAANEATLQASVDFLEEGGVVNIFPRGSVVDARRHPWRSGVGRIIRQLPEEGRGDVLVAPYAMEDVSQLRLVGAVAMRGHGIFGRPQSMDVTVGPIRTAEEIVTSLPRSDRDNPEEITKRLQRQFLDFFG